MQVHVHYIIHVHMYMHVHVYTICHGFGFKSHPLLNLLRISAVYFLSLQVWRVYTCVSLTLYLPTASSEVEKRRASLLTLIVHTHPRLVEGLKGNRDDHHQALIEVQRYNVYTCTCICTWKNVYSTLAYETVRKGYVYHVRLRTMKLTLRVHVHALVRQVFRGNEVADESH